MAKALVATVLIDRLSIGFQAPSLRGWRGYGGLLRFGVKFQASWYTFVAREQGLNIVIGLIAGVGSLGIWTFTNRIFQFPTLAFSSLFVVGFPAMANVLARGEAAGPIILRTVRRTAIAGTFVFATFAAVSPKLVPLVFGDTWADAALIIPLICLSTLLLGSIAAPRPVTCQPPVILASSPSHRPAWALYGLPSPRRFFRASASSRSESATSPVLLSRPPCSASPPSARRASIPTDLSSLRCAWL